MNGRPLARAASIIGGVAVAGAGALTVALISGVTSDTSATSGASTTSSPSTSSPSTSSPSTSSPSTSSSSSSSSSTVGSADQNSQAQAGSNGS